MRRVSIVIPCLNPSHFLLEAIDSARRQKGCGVELILVNDGTDRKASLRLLEQARALVDRYIEQPNRGLAAARNAGFRAATSDVVIPFDSDDRLEDAFAIQCLETLEAHPQAAFAYSDYRVFGTQNYIERLADYNLYDLLERNVLTYAAAIRRRDWEQAGGYDEAMSSGYEDWEFWLNLGERGRFGRHISRLLFRYRKHGPSLLDIARSRHDELIAYIRGKHPRLYSEEGRGEIKSRWSPAVCIAADGEQIGRQTIRDWSPVPQKLENGWNRGDAFLIPGSAKTLRADSAELAALAIWGGRRCLRLPDGSMALTRSQFLKGAPALSKANVRATTKLPRSLERVQRHLHNAGLLSLQEWWRHPFASAVRLIPLRLKERCNRIAGQQLFDLSFYLRFRPSAIQAAATIHQPLRYIPATSQRRRVAFVTPHLGAGGAEAVLLQIATSLDRDRFELFLIATQSQTDDWRGRWETAVDHVYDLQNLVEFHNAPAALYSIAVNWSLETILVQNSLVGYSVLPQLKNSLPSLRAVDLIHSVDEDWNLLTATREAAPLLDTRVAISEVVRARLQEAGTPGSKIRLIRNGIDLQHFSPSAPRAGKFHQILFAGRLDEVKRPLLLPPVAEALRHLRRRDDFRFIVAGDGSEKAALLSEVRKRNLGALFDFRGYVHDIAPLLKECDLVVLPSRAEGVPLIVLEAFASARPVVASRVGGVPEIVDGRTGVCIPPGAQEVQQFAEAVHQLLDQPEIRERMGQDGRHLVERMFDRKRFAAEYAALFA